MTRNLSQREKSIFGFCLFAVFVYLFYQFVVLPLRHEEVFWRNQIVSMKRQLAKDVRVLQEEDEIHYQYSAYLKSLQQKGTEMQEMASILSEIESVAKKLDLRIEDMKPRRIRQEETYNHFPVSIRIRTTVDFVVRFLYALQTPPHAFYVQELRLEKPSIRQSDLVCEIIVSRILIPKE